MKFPTFILSSMFIFGCASTNLQTAAEHINSCTGSNVAATDLTQSEADQILASSCEQLSNSKADSPFSELVCRVTGLSCGDGGEVGGWFTDEPAYSLIETAAEADGFSAAEVRRPTVGQIFTHLAHETSVNHVAIQFRNGDQCAFGVIKYVENLLTVAYPNNDPTSRRIVAAYYGQDDCDRPTGTSAKGREVESLDRLSYRARDHFLKTNYLSFAPAFFHIELAGDLPILGVDIGEMLYVRSPFTEQQTTTWFQPENELGAAEGTIEVIAEDPDNAGECLRTEIGYATVDFAKGFAKTRLAVGPGSCDPFDDSPVELVTVQEW